MSQNTTAASGRPSAAGFLKNNLREYGMLLSLVAIMAFFAYMTGGASLRPLNLTNLILQNSYIVVMALGMLMVIVSGHIDLSVGSVAGFIGALSGIMIVQWGLDPMLAALLCLVAGGCVGAAQGYWIAYFKVPSFIVTLAGMLVFRGLTLALLGGQRIGPFPPSFQSLSSGFIPDPFAGEGLRLLSVIIGVGIACAIVAANMRNRQRRVAHGIEDEPSGFFLVKNIAILAAISWVSWQISSYRGLPNVLMIMLVLIALYAFATTRTTIGRQVYAVGGNERAAKLSGVMTERLTFFTFVNMGVLAALAGLIFTARLNTATPQAGVGFELDVIAACFIGGASAYGGVGRVTGAVIGAMIMGVMNNGMSILGIGIDWQQVIKGLVLLGAVCIDVYNQRR
ncbi:multiple monosaccharide ABC transporter permease [Aureimonas mangrovi]|uniref:multiple monosaccharide ABC transporter permease n=1 Tax=Aureimonas mangrovi TaxID=2758041 RepID=UPI00163D584D|nr:multiple monosaccharide ABC transporter permease [Aureimonas mangrovi]